MSSPQHSRCRIFIGSSSEALDFANALQELLSSPSSGIQAQVWTQGVTTLSSTTIESLTRTAQNVDFAVFLLTPDDVVRSRGQLSALPRDNVLFEFGLFMGAIGRDRVFLAYQTGVDIKILSDMSGVTYAPFEAPATPADMPLCLGPAANKIRAQVRAVGPRFHARRFVTSDEAHDYIYDLLRNDDIRSVHHLAVSNAPFSSTPKISEFPDHVSAFLSRGGRRYWYLFREYSTSAHRRKLADLLKSSFADNSEVRIASPLLPTEPRFSLLLFDPRAAIIVDQPHLSVHQFSCITDPLSLALCHRLFRAYWEFGTQSGERIAGTVGE